MIYIAGASSDTSFNTNINVGCACSSFFSLAHSLPLKQLIMLKINKNKASEKTGKLLMRTQFVDLINR